MIQSKKFFNGILYSDMYFPLKACLGLALFHMPCDLQLPVGGAALDSRAPASFREGLPPLIPWLASLHSSMLGSIP